MQPGWKQFTKHAGSPGTFGVWNSLMSALRIEGVQAQYSCQSRLYTRPCTETRNVVGIDDLRRFLLLLAQEEIRR